jgi:formylglycine-generating enzyme required for sulfatase activity
MEKKIFILFILVAMMPNLFATGLTDVKLFAPENQAIQQDSIEFIITWLQATDSTGEKVIYDLYLGTDPSPALFKNDLNPTINGIIDVYGYEFIYETPVSYDNTVYSGASYINYGADTLSSNTTYYWKVIAKNESGETSESEIFSFHTYRENHQPSIPTLLSPSNGETNVSATPTLIWKRSTDADGDTIKYLIQLKNDYESYHIIASGITDTSYTISSQLEDFSTHHWKVYALDGYTPITMASSSKSSFTVENYKNDPPVIKALTSPANGATNLGFNPIKLKWKADEIDNEPLQFDIYADQTSNPKTLIAHNIAEDSLIYKFNKHGTYFWKVVAKDTLGLTDTSQVYSFSCWEQGPDFAIEMVDLKENNFDMGCDSVYYWTNYWCDGRTSIDYASPNESPKHNVKLDAYQIGKYEITNEQYCKFLNSLVNDPDLRFANSVQGHRIKCFPYKAITYKWKELCVVFDMTQSLTERAGIGYERLYDSPIMWNGTNFEVDQEFLHHPVRLMYYEGANIFANWAGDYRLPTEAEWENAAMGGTQSKGYIFSGSNDYSEVAVHAENECISSKEPITMPVGSLKPNELGIYDMSGNVSEICADFYDAHYYSISPNENPQNNTPSAYTHVLRNSSYILFDQAYFRIKKRNYLGDAQNIQYAGFRIAKSLKPYSAVFSIYYGSEKIKNASINFNNKNYTSDANGQITVNNIKNGTYSYSVTATGYEDTSGTITVSADVSAIINMTIKTYTVTFKNWDNTTLKTEIVDYEKAATAPAAPSRTGYNFTDWDTDFSNVTGNLTVTAQYAINTFNVTFNDWDNTTLKTETVDYGNSATAPTEPTRNGYSFTAWDTDFSNVTSNLTITAQYTTISGIENINEESSIKIYPNPVKDNLVIEINDLKLIQDANKKIYIINNLGEIVYYSPCINNKQTIDLSKLSIGVYFISIGSECRKMIKK